MSNGPLVVAYHGCDITTRDALVTGRQQPKISANPYDWLGPGFYLFESDPERALAFAQTAAENPEYRFTARPIVTPAVVGCVFAAHSCLDMTTRKGRAEYTVAHRQLELAARTTGAKMPVNKPAFEGDIDVLLRGLDRAVINMIHANRPKEFQVVRGAFRQGAELSPGSGFHSNSHIQLALLDLDCVVGWFLPRGAILLSSAPLRGRAGRVCQFPCGSSSSPNVRSFARTNCSASLPNKRCAAGPLRPHRQGIAVPARGICAAVDCGAACR